MREERAQRASIEQRLANRATEQQVSVDRLRRQLVFQRMLVRLTADQWVLKGGFALEVRLGLRARVTKDLDLAVLADVDVDQVHDLLLDALTRDAGDGVTFVVSRPRPIAADSAGQPGWRFTVEARLGGRRFSTVRVDVVARPGEVEGGVGTLRVASPLSDDRLGDATVRSVEVAQHAAEKLHAIARTYGDGRPSTRVKDLVDLVLLHRAGLLPDPELGARIAAVWQTRDGRSPPSRLPDLPAAWSVDYPAMAADVDLDVDYPAARSTIDSLYEEAVATLEP